jgi:hypothetical protein
MAAIVTRESGANEANEQLQAIAAEEGEPNSNWFWRSGAGAGVLLLGGASLVDFRLRFAQSALRNDLSPSYWSLCGLIDADGQIRTVPFEFDVVADVPRANGVRLVSIVDFDDPTVWPNIAVLRFTENPDIVAAHADLVAQRRTIVDLPTLLVAWLAYAWSADQGENPLQYSKGIPSAAFVEAAHSLAGVELTPGLSSSASCPEAIWQAVKWWHEYYTGVVDLGAAGAAGPLVPSGRHAVRQKSAALRLEEG